MAGWVAVHGPPAVWPVPVWAALSAAIVWISRGTLRDAAETRREGPRLHKRDRLRAMRPRFMIDSGLLLVVPLLGFARCSWRGGGTGPGDGSPSRSCSALPGWDACLRWRWEACSPLRLRLRLRWACGWSCAGSTCGHSISRPLRAAHRRTATILTARAPAPAGAPVVGTASAWYNGPPDDKEGHAPRRHPRRWKRSSLLAGEP